MKSCAAKAVLRTLAAGVAFYALALVLAAAPARAQGTPEQRAACEGDAIRLCGEFVPDVERIKACMHRKRVQLSPACRVYFGGGRRKSISR